jgi:hypothetical protein
LNRAEFEHVVRAAADIVDDDVVVVGSQAVLGPHPHAPTSLLRSIEVDLYPRGRPDRASDIDGALGDGSRFHETFGYYAHGVGPETPIAPAGWQDRLVRIEVPVVGRTRKSAIAWCLETHDLVLSKLAAGRPHDFDFCEVAIREKLVDLRELNRRVECIPDRHRDVTRERLTALAKRIAAPA